MFRKIIAILIASVLFMCVLTPLAAFGTEYSTGTYLVKASRVGVYSTCDSSGVLVGELYGGMSADYVTVTAIKGGCGCIYLGSEGKSGWVELDALEFINKYAGDANGITGLSVTPPVKTSYIQAEESFDSTGLKVYANYKNGSRLEVKGYELFIPSLNTSGSKTAYVYYTPTPGGKSFTASFTVNVVRIPVSAIRITKQPSKLSYIENQPLSFAGLEVTVSYSDGRASEVFTGAQILKDSRFRITACHGEKEGSLLTAGTHTIRIYFRYDDIYTQFNVSVRERTLTEFSVTKQPSSAAFYEGIDELVLEGIELTAKYDNGQTEKVPLKDCKIIFDASGAIIGSNNKVTIQYKTKSITFNINVIPNVLVGLKLKPPAKTVYSVGEKLDTTGLVLTGVYNSGREMTLTAYTLSAIDMSVPGVYTVFVKSGEYTVPFTVTVTDKYRKGDSDGDGKITAADARTTLRIAVKLDKPVNDAQFTACDVDSDGKITAADARLVLRAAVGLEILK